MTRRAQCFGCGEFLKAGTACRSCKNMTNNKPNDPRVPRDLLVRINNLHTTGNDIDVELAEIRAILAKPDQQPRKCRECGSTALFWLTSYANTSGVAEGRLRTSEVKCSFVLACEECSETLAVVTAEKIAERLSGKTTQAEAAD